MSDWLLDIWVPGLPVAQGSLSKNRSGQVYQKPSVKRWRNTIAEAVTQYTGTYFGAWEPLTGPMEVYADFYLPRGKTVKRSVPHVAPDLDKLLRSVFDSIAPKGKDKRPAEGAFLTDDSLIVSTRATKRYEHGLVGDGSEPGVRIRVRRSE